TGASGPDPTASAADISAAAGQLADYLRDEKACGSLILFAKSGGAVVGTYSGADVHKNSAAGFVQRFRDGARTGTIVMQVCGARSVSQTDPRLGAFAGSLADLGVVQGAVKTWADGKCLDDARLTHAGNFSVAVLVSAAAANTPPGALRRKVSLCRDMQVVAGDSCDSLASRCKISGADLVQFNPEKNLCATLTPRQYVCCSPGTLPDHTPQPTMDKKCYAYTTKAGDSCYSIADAYGIKQNVIEDNNKKTWGWAGCDHLQAGQRICLSSGRPPFPAPIPSAECGPQKPGTQEPEDDKVDISTLNPCPLNVCCNIWGFCGTSDDFCVSSPADSGAPGTSKPGKNGCVASCGNAIKNNDEPPGKFIRVGYFEAWNHKRKCMTMDVTRIDTSNLTHVHFAFGGLTKDFKVSMDGVEDQFIKFKDWKTDASKVLSFGGWAMSTDPETFQLFRDATDADNRGKFADNVVDFLNANGLHGLDFDWEYPGAPDIPGIPPGTKEHADNYLEFLRLVREKSPASASVSVALPASYWYLKQYPVDKMQDVVDYFVYMTYDLHGQWDAGNKFSAEGCPEGSCLRSHVNKTETTLALAMITKAGVQASKVLVGIASYGRSFRMKDPGCTGPMCGFTGSANQSEAYAGNCTDTPGYIANAELAKVEEDYKGAMFERYFDDESDSNVVVYGRDGEADWVAYMDRQTKERRADWIRGLNFGGTADWAVDLEVVEDTAPDDRCSAEDRTWQDVAVPELEYPWPIEPARIPGFEASTWVYITIVNLTPHRFKMQADRTHSYQMDKMSFGDVPPGRARQNLAAYGKGNGVDTKAEVYYTIEGTDKKFAVLLRTHIPDMFPLRAIFELSGMGIGAREYRAPMGTVPITLVVTGSDSFGFTTNLRWGAYNWMRSLYSTIKDRAMKHVVMPGTHDSGMSYISTQIMSIGIPANTQTQGLSTYKQLKHGARWLDLRVVTVHATVMEHPLWTAHVNDETNFAPIGNTGESLGNVIDNINYFTAESPGEVMFLKFRMLIGIFKVPGQPIHWDDTLMQEFFDVLKTINNRCPSLPKKDFSELTAGELMDRNEGKGCVVILLNQENNKKLTKQDSEEDGIYLQNRMSYYDRWSDKNNFREVTDDQIQAWGGVWRPGMEDYQLSDTLVLSQWSVTLGALDWMAMSLSEHARLLNPILYWKGVNSMSPWLFPNIIQVDYIGVMLLDNQKFSLTDDDSLSLDLATLCYGINLYLLSENCDLSPRRSPLLPSRDKAQGKLASVDASAHTWRSMMYANGTVDDDPGDFREQYVPVLRNGTVFANGTVLTQDVPNPIWA
ncbi:Uncharacterized protein TPAR_00621, partial [Tolypocladium paradoxum]